MFYKCIYMSLADCFKDEGALSSAGARGGIEGAMWARALIALQHDPRSRRARGTKKLAVKTYLSREGQSPSADKPAPLQYPAVAHLRLVSLDVG